MVGRQSSEFFFPLSTVVFSFKRSWSPLNEPPWPVCIVFHLYQAVTQGGTTQIQLRIISQVKFISYLSPGINVSTLSSNVLRTIWIIIHITIYTCIKVTSHLERPKKFLFYLTKPKSNIQPNVSINLKQQSYLEFSYLFLK